MLHDYREVLRGRGVRVVLGGVAVSVAGDAAARVALLLRVAEGDGGPGGLAVVLVLFALPLVLLVGVAGRLADRPDPRRLLVGTALLQLVAALGLAWWDGLVATGLLVLVLQTGFALGNAAWVVALPRLVTDDETGTLVSLHHALLGIATPLGAAIGGLVVERLGDRVPFVLDALTFVPLAVAALLLPVGPRGTTTEPPGLLRTLLPLDGLSALRRQPLMATLVVAVLPFIVALESVNAVEVFLVTDVLDGSADDLGLAEAVTGVGVVVGALAAGAVHGTRRRVVTLLAGLGAASLCQIGEGLVPTFVVYLALAGAVGLCLGVVNACVMSLMVTATEPSTRGSVVALVGGASRSCTLLALALGGLLGTLLGPRTTFVTVGVAGLAIAITAAVRVRPVMRAEQPPRTELAAP